MFYHRPFPGLITLESAMKSRSSAPRWAIPFVLLVLLALGFLFVPECDDSYFIFWKFDSWKDFLLTRPNTQDALVVGVPHNGRYLGNLLGVLQAKLYFTPLFFLRGILLGGSLIALVLLLARRFRSKPVGRGEAFLLSTALVVISSRGMWQQVYSWGAALINYLLPMLGLLVLLDWMEKNPKGPIPLARTALLALACCLFMETVTIYLALAAFAVLVWAWLCCRDRLSGAMALALGSWLGAAIMFLSPGYAQAGSDTRSVGLELAWDNLHHIVTDTFVLPVAATTLISFLLVWLLFQQGCPWWKLWAGVLGLVHLVCLFFAVGDLFRTWSLYGHVQLVLGLVMAVVWLVAVVQWRGDKAKVRVLLLALSLCVLNGPLLFVSPVGPRNLFPGYVALMLVAGELYLCARAQGLRPMHWLRFPLAGACVLLVALYACNFVAYHHRLDYANQQVEAGADSLTLYLLPFNGWVTNELPGKGDISYLVYRDTPWDVTFTFIPWEWVR